MSVNLVSNPSFETVTTGWADNWVRTDTDVYTIDTGGEGQSPSKTNSLEIVGGG